MLNCLSVLEEVLEGLFCNTYIRDTQHLWSALGQCREKPGLVGVEYL